MDREEARVEDLSHNIERFSPRRGQRDKWQWLKETSGVYSVKSAYEMLQGNSAEEESEGLFSKLWAGKAPSNATGLSWKVLLDRIQTKTNLASRNSLPVTAGTACPLCLEGEESTEHLFFSCNVSWRVWSCIYKWLGWSTVLHSDAKRHFLHHTAIARGSKKFGKCLVRIWIATISSLWRARNSVIFDNKSVEVGTLVDSIQHKAWLWMKAKEKLFSASMFEWTYNPLLCC